MDLSKEYASFMRSCRQSLLEGSYAYLEKIKSNKRDFVTHGVEVEGFFIDKKTLTLRSDLTQAFFKQNPYNDVFAGESGKHQLEYRTEPYNFSEGCFFKILEDMKKWKKIASAFAEEHDAYFINFGVPPFLSETPEDNNAFYNDTPEYTDEVAFFKDWHHIHGQEPQTYKILGADNTPSISMKDNCKSLAFVNGIHVNFIPKNLEEAVEAFNACIYLTPFLTALASNGGFINKKLDKKDYRLHIGMLKEDLKNEDYFNDRGLPKPLTSGFLEYTARQLVKNPWTQEDIDFNDGFTEVFDMLREQSWSFIQFKVFEHGLCIEYRPITVQITSEISSALHVFILTVIYRYLEDSKFKNMFSNSWSKAVQKTQLSLKEGPDACVCQMNNEECSALDFFNAIEVDHKTFCLNKKYLTAEEFDTIYSLIREKISLEESLIEKPKEKIILSHNDSLS